MQPTVGRIVHYVNLGDKDGKYPPETQAAIITGLIPNTEGTPGAPFVDLAIIYRTGMFFRQGVPFSEEPERGYWSWPPRI